MLGSGGIYVGLEEGKAGRKNIIIILTSNLTFRTFIVCYFPTSYDYWK
jgi:hypothetical protein